MLRIKDIEEGLLHLVGWQQNYNTSDFKIAENLTQSESGLYFQQVHPLLTLDNMACIAPDFKNTNFESYESSKEYTKGNIVSYNGKLYKLIKDSNKTQDAEPVYIAPDNEEYWAETDPFSEWLEGKTKSSIARAIQRLYNEKVAEGTCKTLCENKMLFDGTGRIVDTIVNKNNLVGFEIVPIRTKGVTTKINKIGLQFTKPGDYTLYLMHSNLSEPVKTIKLTKTKANSLEWFTVDDVYMSYYSEDGVLGGSWYLCYKQSELPEDSQAIMKMKDWSKNPCKGCSRRDYLAWMAWSKYLEVHPFYINEECVDTVEDSGIYMWDEENNIYTYDNNYGLNIELTVACDITDFIIEQKAMFTDIIAKQLAVDMLREFAYNANVRTNRHSINASRLDILYELDGDSSSMKKSGLNYQLDMAFKALKLSTSGIDRVCLPCKNNGIKYRTV